MMRKMLKKMMKIFLVQKYHILVL